MRGFFSLLLLIFFVIDCIAQNGSIIIYRKSDNKNEKYSVYLNIDNINADSIPPQNGIQYLINEESYLSINATIRNYPSWPSTSLRLNAILKDTIFVELRIKKDWAGNPSPQLRVVTYSTAKEDISTFDTKFRTIVDKSNKTTIITFKDDKDEKNTIKRTGTGFLVSSKGFIVTNFHVIENANSISIRGINGDKSKPYNAKIIYSDSKSDIAILKLENIISFDSIPFSIKSSDVDLGEKIEIYGYPLTNSMGDDIKLTNGIVSSINGYQGDSMAYQLSAPVQPGNSGGPVFDENGNLVAVVNAKHLIAENATYAIKSKQLLVALQQAFNYIPENKNINHWKMSLVEQAKILHKFVYIIETN